MSLNGILILDKPSDFTSFDAVAKLRGIARTRKIGHAGTLDPAATGVLPMLLGSATRFVDLLPEHDKRYTATLQLGMITDTQDLTGIVLETRPVNVSQADVELALRGFLGEQSQLPPMYSAVRQNGKRLYDLARQGIEVERSPRLVTFRRLELLSAAPKLGRYVIDVSCSRGTYIRTLCHDLGQRLGCGAAMAALRRTEACGYTLADCRTLEELQALGEQGELEAALMPVETAFSSLPRLELGEEAARLFVNGIRLELDRLGVAQEGRMAVFGPDGVFLGLAQPDLQGGVLRHIRVVARG